MAILTLFIHTLLLSSFWSAPFVGQTDARLHSKLPRRLGYLRPFETKSELPQPVGPTRSDIVVIAAHPKLAPLFPRRLAASTKTTSSNSISNKISNSTGELPSQSNQTTTTDLDTITQRRKVNIISNLTGATNISSW